MPYRGTTLTNGIPNAPFRERFLELEARGEVTAAQIAVRLGWMHKGGYGDGSRVKRALGISSHHTGARRHKPDAPSVQKGYKRDTISLDTAEALCQAMGLDPWEVGL